MWNRVGDWIWDRRTGFILLICGIVAIAIGASIGEWSRIPAQWEAETRTAVVALGTALAIAGFLALTVDPTLKKAIAEDAFRTVMGWVSLPRLKSELERVYQEQLFAVQHRMTITLTETLSGFTRMTLDIERRIKNESLKSREFTPSFSLHNWQHLGRESAITEISARFKGQTYNDREKVVGDKSESIDFLEKLAKPITLARNDDVTVFYKGYEDKLENDTHWETFLIPTDNPTVTVIHPASISVWVQFFSYTGEKEHERETQIDNVVTSQWTLQGVMLPSQAIVIRWWPKDQYSVRQNNE